MSDDEMMEWLWSFADGAGTTGWAWGRITEQAQEIERLTGLVETQRQGIVVLAAKAQQIERLRGHVAMLLDYIVLPGHPPTREQWEDACLLAGRFCEPFLSAALEAKHE